MKIKNKIQLTEIIHFELNMYSSNGIVTEHVQ